MHYVYIIKSEKDNRNYIGSTSNPEKRLAWHNEGKNTSTKYRAPFTLIYKKEFIDKKSAIQYEMWLKKQKGGYKVKTLIENYQRFK